MPLKQTKITFFSPSEGATNEPESENITDQTDPEKQNSDENNNTAPPTSTELTKKVVKRNFREKWLSMYPWLEYDSEKQLMTCKICKERGRKNAFTRGSANFKTSNMDDHKRMITEQPFLSKMKAIHPFVKYD